MANITTDVAQFVKLGEARGLAKIETAVSGTSGVVSIPIPDIELPYIQYANSPLLLRVIASYVYAATNSNARRLLSRVLNVDAAEGVFLDYWGVIVGVDRNQFIPDSIFFGFEPNAQPFNAAPFYSLNSVGGATAYRLTDDTFRALIKAKALKNVGDSSFPSLNRWLNELVPGALLSARIDPLNQYNLLIAHSIPLNNVQQFIIKTNNINPFPDYLSVTIEP